MIQAETCLIHEITGIDTETISSIQVALLERGFVEIKNTSRVNAMKHVARYALLRGDYSFEAIEEITGLGRLTIKNIQEKLKL